MEIREPPFFMQLIRAARLAPKFSPEAAEPPVCTLFSRCDGCPYPAHGFVCWGQDGACLRRAMEEMHGRNKQ